MMKGLRVARTRDGRYVPDTDPEAVVLVYNQHHEVPDEVVAKMRSGPARDKRRNPARDKAAPASAPEPAREPPAPPARPARPPTSGPGSGAPAWRDYIATLPDAPPEAELAELSRDELISLAGEA